MWVARLLKEMKELREEVGEEHKKIEMFLDRWITKLENMKIEIVLDKLNAEHRWDKPGRRGIWICLGNGFNDQILLEFRKEGIMVVDYSRSYAEMLNPPLRQKYVVFDGSQMRF